MVEKELEEGQKINVSRKGQDIRCRKPGKQVEKEARNSKMIEEMWIVDGTKREKQGWVPNSIPVAVVWSEAELPVFSLFEHYALWTDGRTDGDRRIDTGSYNTCTLIIVKRSNNCQT